MQHKKKIAAVVAAALVLGAGVFYLQNKKAGEDNLFNGDSATVASGLQGSVLSTSLTKFSDPNGLKTSLASCMTEAKVNYPAKNFDLTKIYAEQDYAGYTSYMAEQMENNADAIVSWWKGMTLAETDWRNTMLNQIKTAGSGLTGKSILASVVGETVTKRVGMIGTYLMKDIFPNFAVAFGEGSLDYEYLGGVPGVHVFYPHQDGEDAYLWYCEMTEDTTYFDKLFGNVYFEQTSARDTDSSDESVESGEILDLTFTGDNFKWTDMYNGNVGDYQFLIVENEEIVTQEEMARHLKNLQIDNAIMVESTQYIESEEDLAITGHKIITAAMSMDEFVKNASYAILYTDPTTGARYVSNVVYVEGEEEAGLFVGTIIGKEGNVVVAGQNHAETPYVAAFYMTASNADVLVKDITVMTTNAGIDLSKIATTAYLHGNLYGLTESGIYDDVLASASVTSGNSVTFKDVNIIVGKDQNTNFYVKFDYAPLGRNEVGVLAENVSFEMQVAGAEVYSDYTAVVPTYVGEVGATKTYGSGNLTTIGNEIADINLVYKANGMAVNTTLTNGSNNLAILEVTAGNTDNTDESGEAIKVKLNTVTFKTEATDGLGISMVTLERIGGTGAQIAQSMDANNEIAFGEISGRMGEDGMIKPGVTAYYLVRGYVAGNTSGNKSLTLSLDYTYNNVIYTTDDEIYVAMPNSGREGVTLNMEGEEETKALTCTANYYVGGDVNLGVNSLGIFYHPSEPNKFYWFNNDSDEAWKTNFGEFTNPEVLESLLVIVQIAPEVFSDISLTACPQSLRDAGLADINDSICAVYNPANFTLGATIEDGKITQAKIGNFVTSAVADVELFERFILNGAVAFGSEPLRNLQCSDGEVNLFTELAK